MGFATLYPSHGILRLDVGWVGCSETHRQPQISARGSTRLSLRLLSCTLKQQLS
jgi:hypothetical protein